MPKTSQLDVIMQQLDALYSAELLAVRARVDALIEGQSLPLGKGQPPLFRWRICLIPLTPETMRKAAELWAWVRNQGKPTASNDSLDGDVILATQAILQLKSFDQVIVVTTNLKHISRFESEGICVADWQQTLNNLA
ncbi:MAG: hypothetical protein V7K92_20960 [Nostoc sp.]|uniref:type II toxin-antitoxin system VapC family toxin n=1 Tax=Nostoc sp. TaxID=1180 RepID=UPI002FEFE5ED